MPSTLGQTSVVRLEILVSLGVAIFDLAYLGDAELVGLDPEEWRAPVRF